MKKFIFFLLLPVLVYAQDRQTYSVNDFSGGLNVVTDSIDLQPNEAITLDNFVLDRFGALHKRYGVDTWNDSLISGGHIKDVEYVEDRNGDKTLYVATDSFVFEQITWTDTNTTWDDKKISYSRGIIDTAITGQKYILGDTTSWVYAIDVGDYIDIEGDRYVIDSVLSDTVLHITENTTDSYGDTSTYRIIKSVLGNPQLSSFNGKLYVSDNISYPWVYDGSNISLLGIIDSGTVTTTDTTLIQVTPWVGGIIGCTQNSNFIEALQGVDFVADTLEDATPIGTSGYTFILEFRLINGQVTVFRATITSSTATTLNLDRPISSENFEPPFFGIPSSFNAPDTSNGFANVTWSINGIGTIFSPNQHLWVQDSSKNWDFDNYQGFFIINGNNPSRYGNIMNNTKTLVNFNSYLDSIDATPDTFYSPTFNVGDRYYVVRQTAQTAFVRLSDSTSGYGLRSWKDSSYVNKIIFKQSYFHRNRMYSIGYEVQSMTVGGENVWGPLESISEDDTLNTNRVWFSDLGVPNFIPDDWNFDLSGANISLSLFSSDEAQSLFTLRDDLYVITNSNIYRISGEPDEFKIGFDLYVTQVIQGVGTNQLRGVITTKDNVAYIMNQQGIWLFDGNTIEKISYKIDPLIERYRGSSMVAGKFKDNLFFSYPDSNVTIVMHDPTKAFTTWNFGMEFINDQSIAIDSNYFLFSKYQDSAYVMKYPRDSSVFDDDWLPDSSIIYVGEYKSGWQTLGSLRDKVIEDWEIIAYNPGSSALNTFLRLRTNNSDTIQWDSSGFSYNQRTHYFDNIGKSGAIWGRTYQMNVKDSSSVDFFLSNMRLRWYPATRRSR